MSDSLQTGSLGECRASVGLTHHIVFTRMEAPGLLRNGQFDHDEPGGLSAPLSFRICSDQMRHR